MATGENEKILKVNIDDEMKTAYIDYSMSVIVSRALPDVRDGLKPVHRRVLFGMQELGVTSGSSHKKSARIVGEVLGKYHPHGDSSVYDTMVRMAQHWSLRYPLVDGQGNFGSVDGDSPAAMRYTEAKLKKISDEILTDYDKETVDFALNFDDSLEEPTVLPAKLPNLLVNGTSGIAVGMATNMPPHNLNEVVDAITTYIDNREIDVTELMEHIKAPDFPTGGIIYGVDGVRQAYETGKGRVVIRAKADFEELDSGRERIIITEIPYQVNKAEMIEKTADMVNHGKIEGIVDIRDESDRNGMRIVYELKKDSIPNVVLNNLYKHTALQTSFSVNNVALVKGRPEILNLKDIIGHYVDHRHEIVVRRTQYELKKAKERAHILEGYLIALDNIDEVIALIRGSQTADEAIKGLTDKFELTEIQAKAILQMRLQRLTGLERGKIQSEFEELMKRIEYYESVLADETLRMNIIKDELVELKEKFGDERRTEVVMASADFRIEDMIPNEDVVVTISHLGYMKRTSLTEYRTQKRGGRGSTGSKTRDQDFLEDLFVASTHNYLLIFTEKGKCFWMRVFEIPEGTKNSKGRAVQNMINIEPDDRVLAYINVPDLTDKEFTDNHYIVMCTKKGVIKKTSMEAYTRPRSNGIIAINIREGDELLEAKLTNGENEILMALRSGRAIRFNEKHVRSMGRTAGGVRGVRLADDKDSVIGMVCVEDPETSILVVSEKGYGKRTALEDYRITNRGGKGVKTMNITDKTGHLSALKAVTDDHDLMIINRKGVVIRLEVNSIRVMGRATQGVRLINLKSDDRIAAVAKVPHTENNAEEENTENEAGEPGTENDTSNNNDAPESDAPENKEE